MWLQAWRFLAAPGHSFELQVVRRITFSDVMVLPYFLLQRPLQRKHARAEKLCPRPAIHRSFERFQAIDLSFRLAVAPGLSDGISHGVDVALQRASETLLAYRPDRWASFSQTPSLSTFLLLSRPLNRRASRRIAANSGQSFFSASTFAA